MDCDGQTWYFSVRRRFLVFSWGCLCGENGGVDEAGRVEGNRLEARPCQMWMVSMKSVTFVSPKRIHIRSGLHTTFFLVY